MLAGVLICGGLVASVVATFAIVSGGDAAGGIVVAPVGGAIVFGGVRMVAWIRANGLELTESAAIVYQHDRVPVRLDPATVAFQLPARPRPLPRLVRYRIRSGPWQPVPFVGQGQLRTPRRLRWLEDELVERGFSVSPR